LKENAEILKALEYHDYPALVQSVEKYLEYNRWGFSIVYTGIIKEQPKNILRPSVIFQSEFCKVKITSMRDRVYDSPEIHVAYGRLHAPMDQYLMEWNGQSAHCWHYLIIEHTFDFLDGISPSESLSKQSSFPKIYKDFYNSDENKKWIPSKRVCKLHSIIWKHYGQRLFDLFDLRKPNLWVNYQKFVKEIYLLRDGKEKLNSYSSDPEYPLIYDIC